MVNNCGYRVKIGISIRQIPDTLDTGLKWSLMCEKVCG